MRPPLFEIAETLKSPLARFLLQLIISDEEKHQRDGIGDFI